MRHYNSAVSYPNTRIELFTFRNMEADAKIAAPQKLDGYLSYILYTIVDGCTNMR